MHDSAIMFQHPHQCTMCHFVDKSFQSTAYSGTNNQTRHNQETKSRKAHNN